VQDQISAKIIADSVNIQGNRITTFELEYPRFIHGELMTHRMFSRNAASSRAIPVAKVIEQVQTNPAMPVHWGKNQAGMQAEQILDEFDIKCAKYQWKLAAKNAAYRAEAMQLLGLHKQVVNRILEPFQLMKVVLTATEFNNFWWLRDHADAQPEIALLAKRMRTEYDKSRPELLLNGEWHLPYVTCIKANNHQVYLDDNGSRVSAVEALKISASACAQVSYRKTDTSLDKASTIYARLIESEPCHASPTEHQATPIMARKNIDWRLINGITHEDLDGNLWSGNFKGFIQHRQLITNNVKRG